MQEVPLVEVQPVRHFEGLLLPIPLVFVVAVGGMAVLLGLVVVALEDLGVEEFVLVDWLAGNNGGVDWVEIKLPHLL
jgi:hypothetical protein